MRAPGIISVMVGTVRSVLGDGSKGYHILTKFCAVEDGQDIEEFNLITEIVSGNYSEVRNLISMSFLIAGLRRGRSILIQIL